MSDTDGGVLDTYETTVGAWINKEKEKDIKEFEDTIVEIGKYYRKHAFDDDQTICAGYAETIVNLKNKIKELKHGNAK